MVSISVGIVYREHLRTGTACTYHDGNPISGRIGACERESGASSRTRVPAGVLNECDSRRDIR